MKEVTQFKNKKVCVLGLARSGYHASLLLHELGAEVIVNDGKTPQDLSDVHHLEQLGIQVITGYHPENLLDDTFDYMIKNPGIPYTNVLVKQAKQLAIPILTDVELAYLVSQAPILSVSGTNGKTTTTTLLFHMLQHVSEKGQTYLAGNIGIPSTSVAKQTTAMDTIVMEMSSFQLMGVQTFKPKIAIITNVYSAHLDYHGNRLEYVQAKLNMIKNQDSTDSLILNGDLEESYTFAKHSKAKVYYFSKTNTNEAAYIKDGQIFVFDEPVLKLSNIQIPGSHNLENILASTLAAKLYGQSNEQIQQAVYSFQGVKHRSQYIGTFNGRVVYNDSKATNILATQMALNGFDKQVVLIAGGLDRGNGFEELVPSLSKVKVMVVYGQTKDKLYQAGKEAHVKNIVKVDYLEQAVHHAFNVSQEKDVILFSPACASWDQFSSFEERGDTFIELVNRLANKGEDKQ
ncbi:MULTISPECIES: UDP-N-acetylmuramoyl-L-alanine--D-glutamate ligase [unclassified Granulicatella]|uniref:UDP-N-acetylmuramoyl-L-alanine--D-glutamate ligase n=1 Tax=unclassified Granulicatella TaxID=2630493 RepID=UPI0010735DE8|nr:MULTISPECIES: UDP-N-acetylmuramoyl-L-alanine--D-glutamate ligase [unclassified Granulicatella]MBF0780158.1 UDP-N-acetylmuramoyl-L-alanine--D-glutamate ligase [Granulicatella sp. 19428wC4_WM01]TFU95762.1 UDP-N-acetylmuramoyl-L-alanine--D-glutamate ligase [Granulicatella sp. WM01]